MVYYTFNSVWNIKFPIAVINLPKILSNILLFWSQRLILLHHGAVLIY